jgi:chromosome segregation ATPase
MTDRQSTHGHFCWGWGQKHYECAVREIERLRERLRLATVDQATAEAEANDARAEIEAMRAEVAEWKRVAAAQAELHDKAEARAERLAEALRELGEREQRDEVLLRQALEALELRCGTHADERKELIPALRERLGEGAEP